MQRRTALLLSSVAALNCPTVLLAAKPLYPLASLPAMRLNVDGIDTEPINGFIPQVVIGLTNEFGSSQDNGVEGFGVQSSAPGGPTLPATTAGQTPYYTIATLDSGSSANLVSYDASVAFDLAGGGFLGANTATISGASGDEDVQITNALGVYATDFSHASVSGAGALTVATSSLQGQTNVPILVGNQGDGLPNIFGSPILTQYRVTIENSKPQHLTVGGVVSQTPKVTLGAFNTSIPSGYSKLTLTIPDGGLDSPYYLNYSFTGAMDPTSPGVGPALLTNGGVGLSRSGTSATNQTFLLDTGAQLTVISNDVAASVGIFNASAQNADFIVQAQGVGGVIEVPGYYLNTLTLLTQGGLMTWNRVPVIVLDVGDPRNPKQALPGILGTNLFSDRDLILNNNVDGTAQTYLGIGPLIQWNHSTGSNWSNASNWAVALPNGVDMQANFYGAITAPSTINVDSAFTVGRITFDNANRYTLSGVGPITLSDSTNASQINVRTGSHTIATPVTLASDTTITIIPTTSTLTISSIVSGTHGVTVSGFGTLLLSNSNTYTGDTNVSTGTLTVTGSIASKNVSTGIGAILNASGLVNAGLSKSTVLNNAGITNIGPNLNTSGPAGVTLASIEIGSDPTSKLTVLSSPLHVNRTVLVTSGLSFDSASAGQLDLKDNDMIIHGSTLAAVQPLLQSGLNQAGGGNWNGSGIVSSTAAGNTTALTTLGVIKNDNGAGAALFSSFDGQPSTITDILIKYTYYGDANLDGKVNGTDYSRIDNGFLTHLTGWFNGDFNYDGIVNGSDYTLIDNAFNRQSTSLTSQIADPTVSISTELANPSSSVPEPAMLGWIAAAGASLLRRRRLVSI